MPPFLGDDDDAEGVEVVVEREASQDRRKTAVSGCDGAKLPTPPWEVPVFWANAVRLGLDLA